MTCGLCVRLHPTLDILVREDGAVLLPKGWTFGSRNVMGYRHVRIGTKAHGKSYYVHRLVCETFHKNTQNKPTVDHIDRNPSNNFATNLRWATQSEQNENSMIVLGAADYGVRFKDDPNGYKRAWMKAHPESRKESLRRYVEKTRTRRAGKA